MPILLVFIALCFYCFMQLFALSFIKYTVVFGLSFVKNLIFFGLSFIISYLLSMLKCFTGRIRRKELKAR